MRLEGFIPLPALNQQVMFTFYFSKGEDNISIESRSSSELRLKWLTLLKRLGALVVAREGSLPVRIGYSGFLRGEIRVSKATFMNTTDCDLMVSDMPKVCFE